MAISTFEIVVMILLAIGVGIAIWFFIVAEQYSKYMTNNSYARGANASNDNTTVRLTCGKGSQICIYRANQICTNPGATNTETTKFEPISNGSSDQYGDFDSVTTFSLTKDLGDQCNGKRTCDYHFVRADGSCSGEDAQLIATYTCTAPGEECQAHKPLDDGSDTG